MIEATGRHRPSSIDSVTWALVGGVICVSVGSVRGLPVVMVVAVVLLRSALGRQSCLLYPSFHTRWN